MLRKVTRETPQRLRQLEPLACRLDRVIPEGKALRRAVDLLGRETEGLAHVAQRALRPVADHRGCKRGAAARVLAVHVLDHLLAPLVLEVDVDVRRLVALLRHEALEQHVHPRRIDFGDAERIAHHRIGGRSPALAENAVLPGVAHHIVHRQEERLVAQLGDQGELVPDQLGDLRRHAGRKPLAQPFRGEPAQPARRRFSFRHQFFRVFISQ